MAKLKSPILAVDGIIFEKGKILLVKRAIYPFSGYWTLPGGHVEYGEKVEDAILREIKEEVGLAVKIKKLIGVYSDPKRDPRYHIVSVVYLCQKTKGPEGKPSASYGAGKIRLNREASEFKYFSLKNLPPKIGFDHRKIINNFRKAEKIKK